MNNQLSKSESNDLVLDIINDYLVEESLLKKKEVIQELSKVSTIKKNRDKIFIYCQKSAEIRTADRICIIELHLKKNEVKKIKSKKIDKHKVPNWFQRSTKINNVFKYHYMNSITIALNNNKEIGAKVGYRIEADRIKTNHQKLNQKIR
ncbi:hypothetical protein F8M41_011268 [Gigaspora margarita]|uniref:Uncharacterized protein n=1 Tax=Gigaspora margarita TaxID=4874 RepID=A0A8H3WZD2_GIGMA|nr:hypothetical protein F8M41_011268 [Gigaspora margarita]